MIVRLPLRIADWLERWFAAPSKNVMRLRELDNVRLTHLSGWNRLVSPGAAWERSRIPIYAPQIIIPKRTLVVPKSLTFEIKGFRNAPPITPAVTLRTPRARRQYRRLSPTAPQLEWTVRRQNRRKPEENRRRRDNKMPRGVRRAYAAANKVISRPSEYLEFADTVLANSQTPDQLITALALNEAVDVMYGQRARALKQVYNTGYWPFPVGFDTLRRLWR